MDNMAIRD